VHVAVERPQGWTASLALHVSLCAGLAAPILVERLGGEFAQLGGILPKRLFPGFFILERRKNLGGDGVLFVLGELADFPERVCIPQTVVVQFDVEAALRRHLAR